MRMAVSKHLPSYGDVAPAAPRIEPNSMAVRPTERVAAPTIDVYGVPIEGQKMGLMISLCRPRDLGPPGGPMKSAEKLIEATFMIPLRRSRDLGLPGGPINCVEEMAVTVNKQAMDYYDMLAAQHLVKQQL